MAGGHREYATQVGPGVGGQVVGVAAGVSSGQREALGLGCDTGDITPRTVRGVILVANPGDAAWWWQYGLDGLAGGLVGGAVTAFAVWLTIRHERGLATAAREYERREAMLAELRQSAGSLYGLVLRKSMESPERQVMSLELMDWYSRLVETVISTEVRASACAPALAKDFLSWLDHMLGMMQVSDPDDFDALLAREHVCELLARLHSWLSAPDVYDFLPRPDWAVPQRNVTGPTSEPAKTRD